MFGARLRFLGSCRDCRIANDRQEYKPRKNWCLTRYSSEESIALRRYSERWRRD